MKQLSLAHLITKVAEFERKHVSIEPCTIINPNWLAFKVKNQGYVLAYFVVVINKNRRDLDSLFNFNNTVLDAVAWKICHEKDKKLCGQFTVFKLNKEQFRVLNDAGFRDNFPLRKSFHTKMDKHTTKEQVKLFPFEFVSKSHGYESGHLVYETIITKLGWRDVRVNLTFGYDEKADKLFVRANASFLTEVNLTDLASQVKQGLAKQQEKRGNYDTKQTL